MNDCNRTAALLEVYADDEASPETNALVHEHLQGCERCVRELRDIRALRAELRGVLGGERAADALRARIVASLEHRPRHSLLTAMRSWLVPASAAVIVLALWTWWPAPSDPRVEDAVAEHIACALHGRAVRLADAVAAARGYPGAMPWIHDAAHQVHVVDAHTCGHGPTFSHLILDVEGTTASILIAPKRDGAGVTSFQTRRGDFDVSLITTSKHVVFVVVPASADGAARAWRDPVLERVGRFLQQWEGAI